MLNFGGPHILEFFNLILFSSLPIYLSTPRLDGPLRMEVCVATFFSLLVFLSLNADMKPYRELTWPRCGCSNDYTSGLEVRAVPMQTPLVESKSQRLHHKKLYFPILVGIN